VEITNNDTGIKKTKRGVYIHLTQNLTTVHI
jgi:hypothetical protein